MRTRGKGASLALAGAAIGSLAIGVAGAQASTTAATARTAVPGTAPATGAQAPAATPAAAPAATTTEVHIFLGQDQQGLQTLDQQVSDPRSSSYHQFLTPAQVAARFGATSQELSQVHSWLTSQGLQVTYSSPYVVSASGPASAVSSAFATKIAPSGAGEVTNATAMSMPTALAGQVVTATVTGTKALPQHSKLAKSTWSTMAGGSSKATKASSDRGPYCSRYYGQRKAVGVPPAYGEQLYDAPCGYTPFQLRAGTFAAASGLTGKGVTVAIISGDNDSTAFNDANAQAKHYGFPLLKSSQFTAYVEPGSQNGIGDGESALDVESVHAVAPQANIAYVAGGAGETDDATLNALEQIVAQHLGDVVTDSWGVAAFNTATEDGFTNALQRAGAEGITVDTASGDVGSNPPLSYLFPASDPWLTTVGGTSLAIGKGRQYEWQTGWEDGSSQLSGSTWKPALPGDFEYGSTGGISTIFPEPSYQDGIASGNVVNGTAMEEYPDVADDADPDTGYSIAFTPAAGQPVQFATYGGTSEASPLFAATEADVIQSRGGASLGYMNPTLYSLYGSDVFNDVTDSPQGPGVTEAVVYQGAPGTPTYLDTLGQAQLTGLSAGVGFDDVTGMGTPSAQFYTAFDK